MNTADLITRTLTRVGEDPLAPAFYGRAAALGALNLAQRLYCLITLCLEATRPFDLTPGRYWYHALAEWPDWIAPLRVRLELAPTTVDAEFDAVKHDEATFDEHAGAAAIAGSKTKLRPCRISELAARDSAWMATLGQPERYTCLGADLLVFYKNPDALYRTLITYARAPIMLVNDDDVPEIPEPDHSALPDGAATLLRLSEGGQELAASMEGFGRFLATAKQRAAAVRMRNMAQRYDKLPMELERVDLSRLLNLRRDLPPFRKEVPWPISQPK